MFGLWDFLIIVSLAGIFSGIATQYFKSQRVTNTRKLKERVEALEGHGGPSIEDLAKRVEVLERLATDRRTQLKQEIGEL